MNTRNNQHALRHGHRRHPVTLLSAAVATSDKALMDTLELRVDIQLCAYHKWEAAGRPTGDGVRFWLEAEKDLAAEKGTHRVAVIARMPTGTAECDISIR